MAAEFNSELRGRVEASIESILYRLDRLEQKIDILKEQVDRQSGIFKITQLVIAAIIAASISYVMSQG